MVTRYSLLATVGMAMELSGCTAIGHFDVQPYKIRPGETVRANWVVDRGTVVISSAPALPGLSPVETASIQTYTSTASTKFALPSRKLGLEPVHTPVCSP